MKNIRLITLVGLGLMASNLFAQVPNRWEDPMKVEATEIDSQTVRIQWESLFVEHFETGDFSLFNWDNAVSDYPWIITGSQSFDGSFSMQASNAGVDNSTSAIQIMMPIPRDCELWYYGKISSEKNWDFGKFYIDGVCLTSQSGQGFWHEFRYEVTEGEHTFRWEYVKDGEVNSLDDTWYIDCIHFVYDGSWNPSQCWLSYEYDGYCSSMGAGGNACEWGMKWTDLDWLATTAAITDVAIYSDAEGNTGGTYTCTIYLGGDNEPGNPMSSITVEVTPGLADYQYFELDDWVEVGPGVGSVWMVWSTAEGHSFPAPYSNGSSYDDGTWWKTEDGWQQTDLGGGAWLMQMLMYYDSGFPHFKVYRALCDGQDMELIARKLEVNSYLDGQWADLDDGLYKWGVSHVINGVESAISWSECLEKNTTGVEENRFEAVVYPNPANGVVRIEGVEVDEVRVYNALGQMVKIVRRTNEIDVADLVKGIYLLRITDAEGKSHTARVVVKE